MGIIISRLNYITHIKHLILWCYYCVNQYNMVLIYRPLIFWVAVCIHLTLMGKEVRWNLQLSVWGQEWQCDPLLRTTWNSEYWTMIPRPDLTCLQERTAQFMPPQIEAISLEKLTHPKEKASEYNVEGGRNGKWKSFDAPLTIQWSPLLKSHTNAQNLPVSFLCAF